MYEKNIFIKILYKNDKKQKKNIYMLFNKYLKPKLQKSFAVSFYAMVLLRAIPY